MPGLVETKLMQVRSCHMCNIGFARNRYSYNKLSVIQPSDKMMDEFIYF